MSYKSVTCYSKHYCSQKRSKTSGSLAHLSSAFYQPWGYFVLDAHFWVYNSCISTAVMVNTPTKYSHVHVFFLQSDWFCENPCGGSPRFNPPPPPPPLPPCYQALFSLPRTRAWERGTRVAVDKTRTGLDWKSQLFSTSITGCSMIEKWANYLLTQLREGGEHSQLQPQFQTTGVSVSLPGKRVSKFGKNLRKQTTLHVCSKVTCSNYTIQAVCWQGETLHTNVDH